MNPETILEEWGIYNPHETREEAFAPRTIELPKMYWDFLAAGLSDRMPELVEGLKEMIEGDSETEDRSIRQQRLVLMIALAITTGTLRKIVPLSSLSPF